MTQQATRSRMLARGFAVAVALLAAAASAPGQAQRALTGWPADGDRHARIELLEAR
jgi:hypothetical protein